MDIVSICPLKAGSLVWQPAPSSWALTVLCKATYRLEPGLSPLLKEQEDIRESDAYWDDDPRRSLYAPAELVPFKRRADVVLVGKAYAPREQPVRSLIVRMIVGEIDKSIEVVCSRLWTRDGDLREGNRWTVMPLRYERATGGLETWNPVGVDPAAPRDAYGQRPLPNLQPPGLHIKGPDDIIEPIGFGPIAASWPPRRMRLGAGDPTKDWVRSPFGEGFAPEFFQVAPSDQQTQAIRANERITLEHLHPKHERLVTNLPDTQPYALVEPRDGPPRELSLMADTLWIDTDRELCTVTWRGCVTIEHPGQKGRVLIAMGSPGTQMPWATISQRVKPVEPKDRPEEPTHSPRSAPQLAGSAQTSVDEAPVGPAEHIEPPPSSRIPAPPSSRMSAPPSSRMSAPPSSRMPAPPSSRMSAPPSSRMPAPPPSSRVVAPLDWPVEALGSGPDVQRPTRSTQPTLQIPEEALSRPVLPFQPASPSHPVPASIPSDPSKRPPRERNPALFETIEIPESHPGGPPPGMSPLGGPAPAALPFTAAAAPASLPFTAAATMPAALPAPPPIAPPPVSGLLRGNEPLAYSSATTAFNPAYVSQQGNPSSSRTPLTPADTRAEGVSPLELLWFAPAMALRLRKHPVFSPYTRPSPEPPPGEDLLAADVYAILSQGPLSKGGDLEMLVGHALEDNQPVPSLVLLEGDLDLPFAEAEVLKVVIAAASSFAGADKKLKEALDVALEMMKTPLHAVPEIAEGLITRVRDAWSKANRTHPATSLDAYVEWLLLESRAYQKRELLGDSWIRGLLTIPGLHVPIPTYLPWSISRRLPLFKRFPARILAEVLLQQDQHEVQPMALFAAGIARTANHLRARAR